MISLKGYSLKRYRKLVIPLVVLVLVTEGAATVCGVFVETDDATGLAKRIAPLRQGGRLSQTMPEV